MSKPIGSPETPGYVRELSDSNLCTKMAGPYSRLILASLVHAFIGSSAFFHTNSLNQIEVFVKNFTRTSFRDHYDIELEESSLAWVWALLSTGTGIGAALTGFLAKYPVQKLGARNSVMVVKNVVEILAAAIQFAAVRMGSVEALFVGRFLAGYAVVLAMHIPVLLAECSPDRFRGMVAVIGTLGWPFYTNIAALMGLRQVLGTAENWNYILIVPAGISLLHLALTFLVPDSPKYLYIVRNEPERARKAVVAYHGPDADIKAVFNEFDEEAHITHTKSVGYLEILRTRHLAWPFWLCMATTVSAALCAHDIAQQYSTGLIRKMHVSETMAPIYTLVIVQFPSFLMQVLCVFVIERAGRRKLLLIGLGLGIMANVCLFVAQLVSTKTAAAAVFGLLGLFLSTIGPDIGPHPIGETLPGELAPQISRPATSSAAFGIGGWGMPVLTTLLFPPLHYYIGAFAIMPLLVMAIGVFIIIFLFLPETKGRSVDDVVKTWIRKEESEDEIPLSKLDIYQD